MLTATRQGKLSIYIFIMRFVAVMRLIEYEKEAKVQNRYDKK